ncbi:MAG: hypothetical protein HYY78_23120 [Betaproteobacteria bacterium]|nr:hypothetical protein [Betaproteobacteria bacterium]
MNLETRPNEMVRDREDEPVSAPFLAVVPENPIPLRILLSRPEPTFLARPVTLLHFGHETNRRLRGDGRDKQGLGLVSAAQTSG